jgi:hypothetical protein
MKAFRIKKAFLAGLAGWLNGLALSGRDSRERTRFVSLLVEGNMALEKDRKEVIGKFVEKETVNGEEIWKKTVSEGENSDGKEHFVIPPEKIEDFKKEINDLFQEEFVLDIGEEHLEKMATVATIVLNTDYKFGPSEEDDREEARRKIIEANDYEEWCKAFEAVLGK